MSANSEAKASLIRSCIKFLETKTPDKIFITDLVKDCHLNRNTFYYHFTGIPDLLGSMFLDQTKKVADEYTNFDSLEECLTRLAKGMAENKDIILNIFNSSDRYIYEIKLLEICEFLATKYANIFFQTHKNYTDEEKELLIHFYKCQGFGQVIEWLNEEMSYDPMERIRQYLSMYKKLMV